MLHFKGLSKLLLIHNMAGVWSELSLPPTNPVFEQHHIHHEKILDFKLATLPSVFGENRQHSKMEKTKPSPKSSFAWNHITKKTSPVPKKVRFSASMDHCCAKVPIITKKDKRDLWWRKSDMARMKVQAQADAKKDFRAQSYLNAFHRVYNRVVEGDSIAVSEVEKLLLTVGIAMGYRGMEMWGGTTVGFHRLKRMKWVVEGVLHVQKKSFTGSLKPDQRAEILRLTSEYLSRPSLQLAVLIGETDARASHIDNPLLLKSTCGKKKIEINRLNM